MVVDEEPVDELRHWGGRMACQQQAKAVRVWSRSENCKRAVAMPSNGYRPPAPQAVSGMRLPGHDTDFAGKSTVAPSACIRTQILTLQDVFFQTSLRITNRGHQSKSIAFQIRVFFESHSGHHRHTTSRLVTINKPSCHCPLNYLSELALPAASTTA